MQTRSEPFVHSPLRRSLLVAAAASPWLVGCASGPRPKDPAIEGASRLDTLEASAGGRLGVYAVFLGSDAVLAWRPEERFPLCSTFKLLVVSAILRMSAREPGMLLQRIPYKESDLVEYSPITSKSVGEGMRIGELCRAALQYSDNTAGNLLMTIVGGPEGVTEFARGIGDTSTRIDRWETALNSSVPDDPRDTSTPKAMTANLKSLVLGDGLPVEQRMLLQRWLRGNTTGARRIRAGVPGTWEVGDKTGSGEYGTTNDIGVLWAPTLAPIVVSIYYTQASKSADLRSDVVAAAARIVAEAFSPK